MSLSSLLCGFPERLVASQSGFRAFTMPFLRSTELLFSSACFESSIIHLYRCYMSISQEFIALFERVRKVAELIKRARFFYWCLCGIHFYFWFAPPRFMCWPFFHCLKSCIFCVCPFHSNCCWRFKYIALSLFHFFFFRFGHCKTNFRALEQCDLSSDGRTIGNHLSSSGLLRQNQCSPKNLQLYRRKRTASI